MGFDIFGLILGYLMSILGLVLASLSAYAASKTTNTEVEEMAFFLAASFVVGCFGIIVLIISILGTYTLIVG